MATVIERPRLEPHVTALLVRLRARIRRYVVVEGIAASDRGAVRRRFGCA